MAIQVQGTLTVSGGISGTFTDSVLEGLTITAAGALTVAGDAVFSTPLGVTNAGKLIIDNSSTLVLQGNYDPAGRRHPSRSF